MQWETLYKQLIGSYSYDVNEICQPLFRNTHIDYFCYMKSYANGQMLHMTNNNHWLQHYINNHYYEISNFRKDPKAYSDNIILCTQMHGPPTKIAQEAASHFKIKNVITLVEKHKDECEFYQFGSSKDDNDILSFYINNIELLQLFIFYFKDKAFRLIGQIEQKGILIPPIIVDEFVPTEDMSAFKKQLFENTKRFHLGKDFLDSYLTQKEVECIRWYALGKTAEDIALINGCSKKTIEKHFEIIKHKLNCVKLPQILKKALKVGIVSSIEPG